MPVIVVILHKWKEGLIYPVGLNPKDVRPFIAYTARAIRLRRDNLSNIRAYVQVHVA